jgi:hypothetical protein
MSRTAAALLAAAVLAATPSLARAAEPLGRPWFGVRLGGLVATGSVGRGSPTAEGVSLYGLYDARDFLADVSGDVYFGDGAHLVAAGLGAYYPFLSDNVTPYAGGGLKLGWTKFGSKDGAVGLMPNAALGLLLGRYGSPQLRLELSWWVNLSRETAGTSHARSNGPMATFGIGF